MSKIIRLQATNYKRLKAVEITPDGNIVQIAGKNGAGKSSVLDAITAALGGVDKRKTPKPIRDGEDNAVIVLETDELVVTRRFTDKTSTLTVQTHDGAKFPKGQAKLDDLLGKLSLDPFTFTMLSEKEQLETLLNLVDLPFDPERLEMQRQGIFNRRTEVGRQSKSIGEVAINESLPTEEQSAGELIGRIRAQQDRNQEIADQQRGIEVVQDERRKTIAEIQRLQGHLEDLDEKQKIAEDALHHLGDPTPTTELELQLAKVEDTNAAIRSNNRARELKLQKDGLDSEYAQLTEDIKTLDKAKADGLAKAQMPVEGLGFDEHGVTFEGIPFKQTNTASQIRVSFAMAMALNPKLRVIRIAEGSLLDDDNMKLIADMSAEHDFQVWVETVGAGDGTGVIIEDGEIKA